MAEALAVVSEKATERVAVVTGAASGMGRAMACEIAARGVRIIAVDIQADVADILRRDETYSGADPAGIVADLSSPADCEKVARTVLREFGGCDILVNCAGISMGPLTPAGMKGLPKFWESDPAGIAKLMAINATAPQLMARYLTPPMIAKGWGRIVNITTSFDTMLRDGMNAYGASKAALEACSAIWAKELQGTGVTVNVLVPGGPTATPFLPPHMRAEALDPNIMRAPIRWLTSAKSDGVTGRRFVARLWNASEADNRAIEREPAGWPDLAEEAHRSREERNKK